MEDLHDFEALVRRHQNVVCAVAYAVLRDRARSEEVAQEAFLIAWQKLPALAAPPTMPAWLCGIARNLAANAARRRKEIPMDAAPEPVATKTPLDAALEHEASQLAHRALDTLDERDREVVTLYYRNEQSIAEVAAALEITAAAARQRLHRGRERLKDALAAVETTLRQTRPGPAFTAACVAALAAGGIGHAAAATAGKLGSAGASSGASPGVASANVASPTAASPTAASPGAASANAASPTTAAAASSASSTLPASTWLAPLALAAVAIVTLVAAHALDRDAQSAARDEHGASATDGAASTEATGSARPDRLAGSAATSSIVRRIDTTTRGARLDRIAHALAAAASARSGAGSSTAGAPATKVYDFAGDVLTQPAAPDDAPPGAPLSKRTLRAAIRVIEPLLLECYTIATGSSRPKGTITARIRLEGAPGEGTLVDDVTFDGEPALVHDTALVECMRETLETIELPAMSSAETWDVWFPFTVR